MLQSITIENFKCFAGSTLVPLAPLTLLCGPNTAGKSTTLQAIWLLHHALSDPSSTTVALNMPGGLALGRVMEVFAAHADGEQIVLRGIDEENNSLETRFDTGPYRMDDLALTRSCDELEPKVRTKPTTFLLGDRLRSMTGTALASREEDRVDVGLYGERAAQVLLENASHPVLPALRNPDEPTGQLSGQVERWMSTVVTPLRFHVESMPFVNQCCLVTSQPGPHGEWRRLANTGLGVSCAFPIFVASLVAEPGSVLLIDTPEAHLHPSAQTRLGAYLAQVAGAGIQVIVESHSELLIAGIRRATRSGLLDSSDVRINAFALGHREHVSITSRTLAETFTADEWQRILGEPVRPEVYAVTECPTSPVRSRRVELGTGPGSIRAAS